jgi:hypothetical protein
MICILSYCDTKHKKVQLSNLLVSLKEMYPTQKILVYSHYKNLEPNYYSDADYYIFDYTNPQSSRHIVDWLIVRPHNKKFYRIETDWGLAVLQMIKRSSLFIKSISDEGCLFLNYDIDHNLIKNNDYILKVKNIDKDHVGLFSHWGNSKTSLSLTCFYLDLPKIDTDFFNKITEQRYNSYPTQLISEDIFKRIVDETYENKYSITERIPTTISGASRSLPTDEPLRKFFGTIYPSRNDYPNDVRKCLVAWDCKIFVDKIEVQIDNKNYIIINEMTDESKNTSFFAHLPKEFNSQKFTIISVNNEKLDQPYLFDKLDEIYWKKNYHEQV